MEAQGAYDGLASVPGVEALIEDEEGHEQRLIAMIDEERLRFVGSVVLGLNDALVELTGTLAGLSFAFQDNRLLALSGLINGIAASMSMGGQRVPKDPGGGGRECFEGPPLHGGRVRAHGGVPGGPVLSVR